MSNEKMEPITDAEKAVVAQMRRAVACGDDIDIVTVIHKANVKIRLLEQQLADTRRRVYESQADGSYEDDR